MKEIKKGALIFYTVLALPVAYIGLVLGQVIAMKLSPGEWIKTFLDRLMTPGALRINVTGLQFAGFALALYAFAIVMAGSMNQQRRRGEEYGSAQWISPKNLAAKYTSKKRTPYGLRAMHGDFQPWKFKTRDHRDNKILSKYCRLGMNTRDHNLNLNVLVVGGSGSGKTRFMVKPNLMQKNCSFIVTDPKQEVKNSTLAMFKQAGYRIKVLNLIEPRASFHYNPFHYLEKETDVLALIDNLFRNTDGKNDHSSGNDFWAKAESALLQALIFYVLSFEPVKKHNFGAVVDLLRLASINVPCDKARTERDKTRSEMDMIFERLRRDENTRGHICLKQYDIFNMSEDRTRSSILISAGARLAPFNIAEIRQLTDFDDMDIPSFGDEKTVCYICTPDNDRSLNFIISMFYTQAFQSLYKTADASPGQRLKRHVHCVMDEFANICLPNELFSQILSTMRSREISVLIIIQAFSQLKFLYKDSWEKIIGNSDVLLYLGGNEQFTHEWISKAMGKETITAMNTSRTRSAHGSSSQSNQHLSRNLLSPDEIRRLATDECIVMMRGNHPAKDKKFDIKKHRNYKHLVEDYIPRKPVRLNSMDLYSTAENDTDEAKRAQYERYKPVTRLP